MLTESPLFVVSFSPSPFVFAHSGKTVKDDNTKAEKEVKNAMAEVKTVPNEAPQANGNESLVNLCEADISDGTQCDLLLMECICFKILETEE
ncbi:hypothetical protein ATANTOWER_027108 [Ataeniobius toweri]|uniref:Uncharacterized protein n=1 Tax=Ataeniobius toweri TaxID=208326 RepID=A0ABU7B5K1_9TELE|nr:hypothetical protein [Ataeniobius toweri]